jgi:hypothetical protein
MIEIALRRGFSVVVASSRVATGEQAKTDRGWRDKSADVRRADNGWGSRRSRASHQIVSRRFSPKHQVNQQFPRHPSFRVHGEHDETARR